MGRFFITSQGRTGTKWLAWLMNQSPTWKVTHESMPKNIKDINFGTCAPSYLMAKDRFNGWPIGVILRDPRQCMISTCNRAHSIKSTNLAIFESTYPANLVGYYQALNALLEDGATIIDYRRFKSVDYVQSLCGRFGITDLIVTAEMLAHTENCHPREFTKFEQLHHNFRVVIEEFGMPFYEKWISQAKPCIS